MSDDAPAKSSTLVWGLALMIGGLVVAGINWYTAIHDGSYYIGASVLGPTFAGLGLAMVVVPPVPQPGTAPSALHTVRRYAAIAAFALGILAGFASLGILSGWFPIP